ncbi:MAG: succinylglutamate desuccinylase/aspartoacylase family protein [Burkholderiaceae bacterium]|nr:succinylglutamate desuccinylase/aspartoacylase family protein [Burkholderiaceae bacterium]
MSRNITIRGFRLLVIVLAVVAAWYAFSYKRDWFFYYARQDKVVRSLAELERDFQHTGLGFQTLGTVQYGGASLPLWILRTQAASAAAPTICLMAGIHGNEPAGVQALLELARDIAAAPATFSAYRYTIIPLVNPWGWERDLRHNGDNHDTARQFVDGHAQEAALLKPVLLAEHCALLVDLHEDRFNEGFYLLAYGEDKPAPVEAVMRDIEGQAGVMRSTRAPQGVYAVSEDEFTSTLRTMAPLWARMNGVPHAFVVETWDALPLTQRVLVHRAAIQSLSERLLHQP